MLFDFVINPLMRLALARRARSRSRPRCAIPRCPTAQWVTFLRNHDEVDLCRLTVTQREEVYAEFARGRGQAPLRSRHPPSARAHVAAATCAGSGWPTRCSSPCAARRSPLRRRDRHGRRPVAAGPGVYSHADTSGRSLPNAGFSAAAVDRLVHPVVADGTFGYEKVNVSSVTTPASLLSWFERTMRSAARVPTDNTGSCTPRRRAHAARPARAPRRRHDRHHAVPAQSRRPRRHRRCQQPRRHCRVAHRDAADRNYGDIDLAKVTVGGYGYRWICLRRELSL